MLSRRVARYQDPPPSGGIITDGLIARWPFSEGSGTVAADWTGNGRDGSLVSFPDPNAAWVPGRYGDYGIDNEGVAGYVSVPYHTSLDVTDDSTICAHIKTTKSTPYAGIYTRTSTNLLFALYRTMPGAVVCLWVGRYGWKEGTSKGYNDGNWHHVAMATNRLSGETIIYQDGVVDFVINFTPGNFGTSANTETRLGAYYTAERLDGILSDMRLYDRDLSQSEIAQIAAGNG